MCARCQHHSTVSIISLINCTGMLWLGANPGRLQHNTHLSCLDVPIFAVKGFLLRFLERRSGGVFRN